MRLIKNLWRDEVGAVVSAELVTVASVAVCSMVAGLSTLSASVNGEFSDVAKSIRSLDQSYSYRGFRGCNAWTAGSVYTQKPVCESLKELDIISERTVVEAEEVILEGQPAATPVEKTEIKLPAATEPAADETEPTETPAGDKFDATDA